jgi:3-demethylubiquinone-9 3-methyltransferase
LAFFRHFAIKEARAIAAEHPAPESVGLTRLNALPKEETTMTEQKITPCLWFDFNAEEVAHYLSVFPNSRILSMAHYGEFAAGRKGAVMTIFFEIDGQRLLALNGGPQYKFTPALSLMGIATTKPRLTGCGRSSPRAASISSAAGSPTNSAFPGKSSRVSCQSFWGATLSAPIASCGRRS